MEFICTPSFITVSLHVLQVASILTMVQNSKQNYERCMDKTGRGFEYEINLKFNHGFNNHGCLHCAILKAHKTRYSKFLYQNFQKNNMKFTRAAC